MRFTDIFIQRPVLAIVISSLLLLLGLSSAGGLQIREFPELERSVISVTTQYQGASARTVEGFVTTPLQAHIAGARGVEYMTATSDPSTSEIQVYVKLGENSSDVLSEVIAKVSESRSELPSEIEDPIVTTSQGGDALMYLGFSSRELSIGQVTDYLMRNIQPELVTLDGMGSARIIGGNYPAMRIWLDPVRMAALGVTAEDINAAIRRDNYISSTGATEGQLIRVEVDARTDMQTPEAFAELAVKQDGDERVRLGDVAEVELGNENSYFRSYSSGEPAMFIAINPAPGANPLELGRAVKNLIPRMEAALPADMKLQLNWDGTVAVEAALREVAATMVEAALIVVLVIYLFLGSLRVVIIPLVTIPLSLIGVLCLVLALGYSLNLLTLLAMVIAIGLVVDDAIVVVENVHRHIEEGASPLQAALSGAREVAWPVVAMTVTLAAVYAPIAFIGGLTGALFSEFALTLAGAVFISGIVALTLSPMMCSRVLQGHKEQARFASWLDARFEQVVVKYRKLLDKCLRNRGAVLLFAFTIVASIPLLFALAQQELAPAEDSGELYVMSNIPRHANIEYTSYFLDQLVKLWKQVPEASHSWQVADNAFILGGVSLVPWDQRTRNQETIQADLQNKFNSVAGLEVFVFGSASLPGSDSGLPVSFVVASTADYQDVERVGQELLEAARASGLFVYITQSLKFDRPEIQVNIDRERAARLGISMEAVGDTLSTMLGEADTNRFSRDGRSYKVIAQAAPGFRLTDQALEDYYLRTGSGALVPLSSIISLSASVEPNTRTQYQQMNSTTLEGIMMPPNSVGTGLAFLKNKLAQIAPANFRDGYTGSSRRLAQESASFPILFGLSMILIYLVLAAQFNSFRDPLVVLVSVPLSIFGAVVPIALGFVTLNIYTQVGLLTLIGLISKHGILIVDFANHLALQGMDRHEAVSRAAALRLRPVLMTTFATVLGVLPLVLGSGAGAESRFSIGLMITTGMLVGTLFTLFVLPTLYLPFGATRKSHTKPAVAANGQAAAPQSG